MTPPESKRVFFRGFLFLLSQKLISHRLIFSRGTCIVCEKEVYWSMRNLASHKRSHCIIPETEKYMWSESVRKKSKRKKESKRIKVESNENENEIYLMEPSDESEDSGTEDETVETALKYFKLELNKMDHKKREYMLDKIMIAFLNAKASYPN